MNPDIPHVISVISTLSFASVVFASLLEMHLRLDDRLNAFHASLDRYSSFIEHTRNMTEKWVSTQKEVHNAAFELAHELRIKELLSEVRNAYQNLPARNQRIIRKKSPELMLVLSGATLAEGTN